MKKHLIIAGIICAIIIPPAGAVTKCVALKSNTTCSSTPEYYQIDWYATCTTTIGSSHKGVGITGISACSSTSGNTVGKTSERISTSSTTNNNKYCWCKMTSPVVSQWVFNNMEASNGGCIYSCSYNCAKYAQNNASFRNGLFSNLSD